MSDDAINMTIRSWANFVQPTCVVINPVSYERFVAYLAQLDRKLRRVQRMARKKRRGWA